MRRLFAVSLGLVLACFSGTVQAADVELEKTDTGVVVKLGGQPFTTYLFKSGAKPILWPIIGPTGKEMTRAYPMRMGDSTEKTDHIHQRSFWFTHGEVNGIDFWAETAKVQGRIEHRELVKAESGPVGTIVTRNEWLGPDDAKVLADVRTLRFGTEGESRWIDFDIKLTALADEVKFGDTKEGSFGLRIAESMRTDRKMGGKIISSEGLEDGAAWGKPAAWVDYHGPVANETVGIAIFNHPSSFRFPTHWHVRTYGLFAANPFGEADFSGKKEETSHVLKKGESIELKYRVLFHRGDEKQGKVAEAYSQYSKQ